jgi:predicted Zn-dependent protease
MGSNLAMTDKVQGHIDAAEGWLELGDWQSANRELEKITPQFRGSPAVLAIRYDVLFAAKKWDAAIKVTREYTKVMPECHLGWLHEARVLHLMGRPEEAREMLLNVVVGFPDISQVHYNLAVACTDLKRWDEARACLKRAIKLEPGIRKVALKDECLEKFWEQIGEI